MHGEPEPAYYTDYCMELIRASPYEKGKLYRTRLHSTEPFMPVKVGDVVFTGPLYMTAPVLQVGHSFAYADDMPTHTVHVWLGNDEDALHAKDLDV